MRELSHVLELEKSSRSDLELYVAVLNKQKDVSQEDADKLRKELKDGKYQHIFDSRVLTLSSIEIIQSESIKSIHFLNYSEFFTKAFLLKYFQAYILGIPFCIFDTGLMA